MQEWTSKQVFAAVTVIIFAVMATMMIKAAPASEGLIGFVNVCPWWAYPVSLLASATVGALSAGCHYLNSLKERARINSEEG